MMETKENGDQKIFEKLDLKMLTGTARATGNIFVILLVRKCADESTLISDFVRACREKSKNRD
jgi:hypothetical protein